MYLPYIIGFGSVLLLIVTIGFLKRANGKKRAISWVLRIVLYLIIIGGVVALLYFARVVIRGTWG